MPFVARRTRRTSASRNPLAENEAFLRRVAARDARAARGVQPRAHAGQRPALRDRLGVLRRADRRAAARSSFACRRARHGPTRARRISPSRSRRRSTSGTRRHSPRAGRAHRVSRRGRSSSRPAGRARCCGTCLANERDRRQRARASSSMRRCGRRRRSASSSSSARSRRRTAPTRQHAIWQGGAAPTPAVSRYQPLPTTPAAEFDLALLVPTGATAARRRAGDSNGGRRAARDASSCSISTVGQGSRTAHRSLAWRLTFRHPERTLRDKEIEGRRAKISRALDRELDVRQRST